jgi:4,5-DOPA dioxygenase extradiol
MNAIEDNAYSRSWIELGQRLPRPTAILCISAHWLTRGTHITANPQPATIHDFGGFPQELFNQQYPAPGDPALARRISDSIDGVSIGLDMDWGFDHGSWSVLKQMYPQASIPLLQLSIDYHQPPQYHYQLGTALRWLRDEGVLILGSGNIVHNLRQIKPGGTPAQWAKTFDGEIAQALEARFDGKIVEYAKLPGAALAVPTPDHYYPLLYALGAAEADETPSVFNTDIEMGSISMRSLLFG